MASESSQQPESSEVQLNPIVEVAVNRIEPEVPEDVVLPAPDTLPDAVIMENPSATPRSSITQDALEKICFQHQLPLDMVRLPEPSDRPHTPPEGYTACNRYIFWSGAIPPFTEFLRNILREIGIAPGQLIPNSYAQLQCMYMLFLEHLFREPTIDDVRFIYRLKSQPGSPYIFFESSKATKILTGQWHKLGAFKSEWFYIRCPPGFAQRWLVRRMFSFLHEIRHFSGFRISNTCNS